MKTKVLNKRVTLFTEVPMVYNDQTLPTYIQATADLKLIPSLNKGLGLKIGPDGSVSPEQMISLDLKNLEDTIKITLGINRFDIISTLDNSDWESFVLKVHEICNTLTNIYNKGYNRLAVGASIVFYATPEQMNNLYQKLVKAEEIERPVEWSIRKVIRTQIEDDKNKLTINNVYTISRKIIIDDGNNTDAIVLEYDINTLVGSNISAINSLTPNFIKNAVATISKSMQIYSEHINS